MANKIGTKGEEIVAKYMQKKGYKILQQNFRTRTGEIDLIVCDSFRLKFIEVKTMLHMQLDNLQFLINYKKQEKIVQTAKQFLIENLEYKAFVASFDVAVLTTNPFLNVEPEIFYIENAFGDIYER